jgi:hypothetical protein
MKEGRREIKMFKDTYQCLASFRRRPRCHVCSLRLHYVVVVAAAVAADDDDGYCAFVY